MACNYEANKSSSTFILAALVLLFIGNAPLGHGEAAVGVAINSTQIHIIGKLHCTSTGNPQPGAPGAAGVRVSAACKGTNALTVGTAITNEAGFFNISLNATIGISLSLSDSPCSVTVALPATAGTNCTALPLNGVLTSIPTLLSVGLSSIGLVVVELVAGLFSLFH